MANTYFKLKKTITTKGLTSEQEYTNDYSLSLTAFMGKENHTQLTIQTKSTLQSQNGIGYIVLNDNDVDNLIAGLLERKLNKISATGIEKSNYCPATDN